MNVTSNPEVKQIFKRYPATVKDQMSRLRKLVLEAAAEIEGLTHLEETLKWGEPSYLTKHGSTLRMDWKPKKPQQYALYFKCTSLLVPTFKVVYDDLFKFEGDRAIVFDLDEKLPETELKQCIKTTLTYHKVKKLARLGL